MFDFGPFGQGSPLRHAILSKLVEHLGCRKVRVLEVGSWTGESALVWASTIDHVCPEKGSVLCVDPWEPYASAQDVVSPVYEGMNKMLLSGEALHLFEKNISFGPPGVPIHYYRAKLSELPISTLGRFDIVYVDGSHYLNAVRKDLAVARSLVAPGGLICGDDLELQGSRVDLQIAASLGDVDYTTAGSGGFHYHPGVTVAVWEAFGAVWERGGVWAMQRGAVSHDFFIPTIKGLS